MIINFKKILIIAPHLDDETIALGGTIKKLTKAKFNVNVIIVGGHLPPQYNKKNYLITKKESEKSLKILDKDHYGLTKIKERIIEYLAVQKRIENIESRK